VSRSTFGTKRLFNIDVLLNFFPMRISVRIWVRNKQQSNVQRNDRREAMHSPSNAHNKKAGSEPPPENSAAVSLFLENFEKHRLTMSVVT
jgi:hypothetical protein